LRIVRTSSAAQEDAAQSDDAADAADVVPDDATEAADAKDWRPADFEQLTRDRFDVTIQRRSRSSTQPSKPATTTSRSG
jgi:hypothetical protein